MAFPLLAPAFFGAALLLFANALSAFATIVAWENQISYTVPQQIYISINSEVGLARRTRATCWPSAWWSSSRS